MRREFALSEDDTEGLDAMGLRWETVRKGGPWLLLHDFEFPAGYHHQCGSVAIQMPGNYPVAPLDMAYFFPHLARMDGRPLRQTNVFQPIEGKPWQRWSRHYRWVPGQHTVCTHIVLVRHWLKTALQGN
jgi:Prokaryotic E2 family E